MYRSSNPQLTRRALAFICLWLAALTTPIVHAQSAAGGADIRMDVLPGAVFPNQRVNFVLRIAGVELTARPEIPKVRGAILRSQNSGRSTVNGKTYTTFLYSLTASQPGKVEISPFTLETRSGTIQTQPYSFMVLDNEELVAEKRAGKKAFVVPSVVDRPVYQRESFTGHLTLFFDPRVEYASNDIPEFESQGYAVVPARQHYTGQALIDGSRFEYISFPIEITPIEAGTMRVTSLSADMMAYERGRSNSIFSTRQGVQFSADGLETTFEVNALPESPDGFSGAVGQYTMDVSLPKIPASAGDPVEVELRIKGTGKEEFVSAPQLMDPDENWKIYDMGESRTVTDDGTILFRKVLRPTKPTNEIPPFLFTYFDPAKERYVSLESNTDKLPWKLDDFPGNDPDLANQATGTSPAPSIATAEVSFPSLESPHWVGDTSSTTNLTIINLAGAITALALLALLVSKRSALKTKNDQVRKLLHTASKKSNPLQDRLHALLAARSLLQPDDEPEDDWQTLAEIHDRLSYSPGKPSSPSDEDITSVETIMPKALQSLRQREAILPGPGIHSSTGAMIILCGLLCIQQAKADDGEPSSHLDTAKQAIAEQNWTAATEVFEQLHATGQYSPETLLAEGACYAKLEQAGRAKAALAQALAVDFTTWPDVRRNLTLIDTSPKQEENIEQLALIAFPTHQLTAALFVAFWLGIISLIARKLIHRRWIATAAFTISAVAFITLAAATIYLKTFPDSRSVAILVTEDTLRNVPLKSSAPGPSIAGGELATVVETSDEFVLLEQLNDPQNRGWVPIENVTPLNPTDTGIRSLLDR